MMRKIAITCLLIVAPAQSQNVTCYTSGQWTNCNATSAVPTTPAITPNYGALTNMGTSIANAYQQGALNALRERQMLLDLQRQHQLAATQEAMDFQQQRQAAFNEDMLRFIKAGQCDQAKDYAIRDGRYDIAANIANLCRAPSQPAASLEAPSCDPSIKSFCRKPQ